MGEGLTSSRSGPTIFWCSTVVLDVLVLYWAGTFLLELTVPDSWSCSWSGEFGKPLPLPPLPFHFHPARADAQMRGFHFR